MPVDEEVFALKAKLEEDYGVRGAAILMDRLPGGWNDLVTNASLLIGSIPGVIIGAHVSSRAPDAVIRPILVLVLALSALKLLNVPDAALATVLGVALAGAAVVAFVTMRRRFALIASTEAATAAAATDAPVVPPPTSER